MTTTTNPRPVQGAANLLVADFSQITDSHIKRANAGNTVEAMVAAYRAEFGAADPPSVAEVTQNALMFMHIAEHEAKGTEMICWCLADALSRLAKGKRGR